MRQRGPCVRALCEPAALLLSKNMARTRPRCNATPSEDFVLQKSHLKLHTSPFTLHTSSHLISSHLISSHLASSYLISSHLISSHICNLISSQLISSQLFWTHSEILCVRKLLLSALPSTILYYKPCTKYFPVLFCTTRLAQRASQYYFVLQVSSFDGWGQKCGAQPRWTAMNSNKRWAWVTVVLVCRLVWQEKIIPSSLWRLVIAAVIEPRNDDVRTCWEKCQKGSIYFRTLR